MSRGIESLHSILDIEHSIFDSNTRYPIPDTRYPIPDTPKMTDPVLHLADFARYLNRTFTLRIPEGGAVTAELVEVEELTGTDSLDDRPREPFTLVFKLEEGAELIQRMYDVAHGDTVWRGMVLVPVQSRKQGHFVQAVFN